MQSTREMVCGETCGERKHGPRVRRGRTRTWGLRASAVAFAWALAGVGGARAAAPEPPAPSSGAATSAAGEAGLDRAELKKLRAQVQALQAWREEQELEQLKAAANAAAQEGHGGDETLKLKTFQGGSRALQALNPEISVTGDLFLMGRYQDGQDLGAKPPTQFGVRGIGLHIQSNLDPFSFMKAAIEVGPEGAELGEGYATWTNIVPRLNLTAGKFRQQLGVVNRWHKHALDYFDFPLMILEPFSPEGLNQIGVSLEWLMPSWWASEEGLILQVTDGMNEKAFDKDGAMASVPTALLHLRNYWDLSRDTYLEVGLTGILGWNNADDPRAPDPATGFVPAVNEGTWRKSVFVGADLTLAWEPLNKAKYEGVTWRTEGLYSRKDLPSGLSIETLGGYTSLDARVSQSWHVGVRGDLTQKFAFNEDDKVLWQVSPYATWSPSPWSRFHLEYNYEDGEGFGPKGEHRVILQAVFAAGPHKHDRY